jgi:FixJ family two-component response regulator
MSKVQSVAIVDDDIAIREALQDLLKSCGYRTQTFASAEEFLAGCHLGRIGCIILDIKMAGLSGIELQAELVSRGSAPPIIFLTSQFDASVRAAALAAGAIAFLEKPVDDEILLESLKSAMPG